jgi:hypothetical protein
MPIQKDGSILITSPTKGTGRTYLDDFTVVQCLDVSSVPGVAMANGSLGGNGLDTSSHVAKTFTVDASTNILTVSVPVFTNFQAITVSTTTTLPAPLAASTTYYVFGISGSTLKLATTLANAIAGTAIDITNTGTGTHSIVGTQMGKIKKILQDNTVTTANYRFYAIDDGGKVWVNYGSVPWVHLPGNAAGAGQGLALWKGYIFAFGNGGITSTYGPLSAVGDTAAWTSSWQDVTDADGFYAPSVVGQDDILYFAFGRHIYSVEEVSGQTFAPGTAGTYAFVNPCLTLPAGYRIKTMVELADRLAIGTWKGTDISLYSFEDKTADIFFWDRSSASFDLPVQIKENGVNQMISFDGMLYAVCGYEGRIYVTNGSTASLFTTIPASMVNGQQSTDNLWFFPNAIMRHKGRIFFGVGAVSGTSLYPCGIYSLDVSTGHICVESLLSTSVDGSANFLQIGALISTGEDEYYCGVYTDNAQTYKGRIDKSNGLRYSGDEAFYVTGLLPVGSFTDRKTYTNLDISLSKPLATSQSVKVWYRTAITGTFTLLGTYSYTTYGATQDLNVSIPIIAVSALQFKVAINGSGATTPELKYILVRQ